MQESKTNFDNSDFRKTGQFKEPSLQQSTKTMNNLQL